MTDTLSPAVEQALHGLFIRDHSTLRDLNDARAAILADREAYAAAQVEAALLEAADRVDGPEQPQRAILGVPSDASALTRRIEAAVRAAVETETERCAKECEESGIIGAGWLAAAIRGGTP